MTRDHQVDRLRDEVIEPLKRRLVMPGSPTTPAQHFSADLLLRYLPQVLKRARGLDASDPLVGLLAEVLRRWPLSGILSDVEEGPTVPLDFAGHRGLQLLYAERVAVVPGDVFGASGEGHVRCCYATALSELEEALVRIERFLGKLPAAPPAR